MTLTISPAVCFFVGFGLGAVVALAGIALYNTFSNPW